MKEPSNIHTECCRTVWTILARNINNVLNRIIVSIYSYWDLTSSEKPQTTLLDGENHDFD